MKGPEKKPMTVVAELELIYPGGREVVRSFETAWVRQRKVAETVTPVRSRLLGFVRKEKGE